MLFQQFRFIIGDAVKDNGVETAESYVTSFDLRWPWIVISYECCRNERFKFRMTCLQLLLSIFVQFHLPMKIQWRNSTDRFDFVTLLLSLQLCSCHASISLFLFPLKRPRIKKSFSLQNYAPLLGTPHRSGQTSLLWFFMIVDKRWWEMSLIWRILILEC